MYNVAVIDDEWWILQGILKTFNFKENGFKVVLATTDAEKAFSFLQSNQLDAVFTDIRMPEFSGIELLEKSRKLGSVSEFIIISGYAEFSYAQDAIRAGAFDYCLKPIKKTKADSILKSLKEKLNNKNTNSKNKRIKKKLIDNKFAEIDNPDFRQLLNYIAVNYSKRLYLKNLAKKFGFNSNYICHLFNKYLAQSFSEYLTNLRMDKAIELLKQNKLTISEIANQTGYNDYYYFNKVFKKYFGITATEYRKKYSEI
ncbi:response regulator transcription factor [Halanaerobium salsuginis]|uniref:Stage 0 sporulation protein A homolog n=1 Tax=Halanaerobium salsuginis TaxID=29563 RepID=A0A1I4JU05_9FIRM|nr:helix-turn-helix domain-containing protein [Halanaerobium salsuginis]SFL70010.1 Helix-turn-helix domain-containing protein [Halanaerobium salsuginis]